MSDRPILQTETMQMVETVNFQPFPATLEFFDRVGHTLAEYCCDEVIQPFMISRHLHSRACNDGFHTLKGNMHVRTAKRDCPLLSSRPSRQNYDPAVQSPSLPTCALLDVQRCGCFTAARFVHHWVVRYTKCMCFTDAHTMYVLHRCSVTNELLSTS